MAFWGILTGVLCIAAIIALGFFRAAQHMKVERMRSELESQGVAAEEISSRLFSITYHNTHPVAPSRVIGGGFCFWFWMFKNVFL